MVTGSDRAVLAVDCLATSEDIVSALRAGSDLLASISAGAPGIRNGSPRLDQMVIERYTQGDGLYRSFALRALSTLHSPFANSLIAESLGSAGALDRQSAAWAATNHVSPTQVPALAALLRGEPFDRMLSQLALLSIPDDTAASWLAQNEVLGIAAAPDESIETRVAAIECLARLPLGDGTITLLRSLAFDATQSDATSAAALRALGDHVDLGSLHALVRRVTGTGSAPVIVAAIEALSCVNEPSVRGPIAAIEAECERSSDAASTTVHAAARQALRSMDRQFRKSDARRGLHIAQLSLRGSLDGQLASVGEGDGGGLATLLINLGRALGQHREVEQVYTVTRAYTGHDVSPVHAQRVEELNGPSSQLVRIPFGPAGIIPANEMWGSLLQIERGLHLFFSSVPRLDAVHLRFADAGTWAASRWAAKAEIPIHFTLAPDPYVPIRSAQAMGSLTRKSFDCAEGREHYLYRAHVLDWMVGHAAGLALLPRPHWERDAPQYFGIDPRDISSPQRQRPRLRVIAEGIALSPAQAQPGNLDTGRWKRAIASHMARYPERRGKPIILTVGRLHPVKGIPRLIDAWANDPELRDAFNLVVVGGNTVSPSDQERQVLTEIATIVKQCALGAGLLLLGNVPNREVALVLAAARDGVPNLIAPRGLYVCASEKEEFGLAILEAMAASMLVVAPAEGGPSTYVIPGETGFLVNTLDIPALRSTIRRAARVRHDVSLWSSMADNARRVVQERYSIDRMASELVDLYGAFAPATRGVEAAS